jgi:hypothetical protein
VVRLTRRGRAAYAQIGDILQEIEREWSTELGAKPFAELKALLVRVWKSPLAWPDTPSRVE